MILDNQKVVEGFWIGKEISLWIFNSTGTSPAGFFLGDNEIGRQRDYLEMILNSTGASPAGFFEDDNGIGRAEGIPTVREQRDYLEMILNSTGASPAGFFEDDNEIEI